MFCLFLPLIVYFLESQESVDDLYGARGWTLLFGFCT
jgi:hypothetical protein